MTQQHKSGKSKVVWGRISIKSPQGKIGKYRETALGCYGSGLRGGVLKPVDLQQPWLAFGVEHDIES